MQPSDIQRLRISTLLEAQFPGINHTRFTTLLGRMDVEISRKTQRIRQVYDITDAGKKLLLSLRTGDGRLIPSFEFGKRLHQINYTDNNVVVQNEVSSFIEAGKSVFCKHVTAVGCNIFPQSEVLVVNENQDLLGVGTAMQPGYAMIELQDGVAVKVKKRK